MLTTQKAHLVYEILDDFRSSRTSKNLHERLQLAIVGRLWRLDTNQHPSEKKTPAKSGTYALRLQTYPVTNINLS